MRSIVAGWWPSHPAEPIRGAMVSDQFPLKGEDPVDRPMRPGAVSPPELAACIAELRVHPSEIDSSILEASQKVMLTRLKRKGGDLAADRLRAAYTGQLVQVQTFLRHRPDIAVLPIDYAAALADPAATAARLREFLGDPFDAKAAADAIDPKLRRQRSNASKV